MSDDDDDEDDKAALPPWPERLRVAFTDSRSAARLVWSTHRGYALAIFLLMAIGATLPALIAGVGRELIDAVVRASEGDPAMRQRAITWVAVEFGLVLLMNGTRRASRTLTNILQALVGERVNEMILEKALALELADYEKSETYDRMTKARREASYRPMGHVTTLLSFAQELTSLGALSALLYTVSGWAVLIVVIAAAPGFIASLRFDKEAFRLFSWRAPETRKQNYLESVITRADHAKEVKLFELGPPLLERYRAIFKKLWDDDRKLMIDRAVWGLLVAEIGTLAYYGLYGWAVWSAAHGTMSVADMTLCVLVLRDGQGNVQSALSLIAQIWDDRQYLRSLFCGAISLSSRTFGEGR
jgi:ATP-binding cassette subfamily B protein